MDGLCVMFGDVLMLVLELGEEMKLFMEFGCVLDFCVEYCVDWVGVLFVVGGGVIGDLGGFVVVVFLCGIEFF